MGLVNKGYRHANGRRGRALVKFTVNGKNGAKMAIGAIFGACGDAGCKTRDTLLKYDLTGCQRGVLGAVKGAERGPELRSEPRSSQMTSQKEITVLISEAWHFQPDA